MYKLRSTLVFGQLFTSLFYSNNYQYFFLNFNKYLRLLCKNNLINFNPPSRKFKLTLKIYKLDISNNITKLR